MALDTEESAISPELTAKMESIVPGRYGTHRSWGFGRIREVDENLKQVTIDFLTKKGHSMQIEYAAQTFQLLPDSHILAQKLDHRDELKQKAISDPIAVVKNCIESLGSQATTDNIQQVLSPDIIAVDQWKKWWDSVKRTLKKEGLCEIPTKKTDPFVLLEEKVDEPALAQKGFRDAVGTKAVLAQISPLIKSWSTLNQGGFADEVIAKIDETMARTPASQLAVLVELSLGRAELLKLSGRPADEGPRSLSALIPKDLRSLGALLDQLAISKQEPVLTTLQAQRPDEWPKLFLALLSKGNARTAEAIVEAFVRGGRGDDVYVSVDRLIRERNVTSDFMYWLGKNRPKAFAKLVEPRLFLAILSVLERDMLSEIKKGTKLYELVLNDKGFIAEMLQGAPLDDVRDVTRAIILSPVFKELDKRSLLGTLIKLYPAVQSMVAGEKTSEESTLIVSWSSLERRKNELEEIVNKKIPENSKDIGIARSYGDLRENHEFKSAKEMQTILMRRKSELESMLMRARGTDFANVDTSQVNIGTKVTVIDTASGQKQTYTILGAWDSEPTEGILSYLTALAKSLLNHKIGDVIEVSREDGEGTRSLKIELIESYK